MRSRLLPLAALLTTACYQYSSATLAPIPAGRFVRVQMLRAAAQDAVTRYGDAVAYFEGRLLGATPDSLDLAVERVAQPDGYIHEWGGGPVRIPRRDIAAIEEEQLAPLRTAAVAAGVALLVTALVLITSVHTP